MSPPLHRSSSVFPTRFWNNAAEVHEFPGAIRLIRRRRVRRRQPQDNWRWPLALAVSGLLLGALLFLFTGFSFAATPLVVATARGELLEQAVDFPFVGPLDAALPQTSRITARDGTVLAEIRDIRFGDRVSVPLKEISQHLMLATMAAEDRRFYEHAGVDLVGLFRALGQNAGSVGVASGASTLEMQLVRNLYLPDERHEQTLSRKLKEAVTAYRLNQHYAKPELLEAYLNTVYYANQAYGAEAAAQRYFGKSARDLQLHEAALLAGIPQSPSAHDPLNNFSAAKARQQHILDLMEQAGYITREQNIDARLARLHFVEPEPIPARAPHWVNYVRDLVRARYGPELLFTAGLEIRTSIDLEIQELAEQIVAQNEDVRRLAQANNSAMVVLDPATGQVLAMVGSKNFWNAEIDGQVNVAVAGRQPGSSIKPLVYLSGFEKGLNPAVEVIDERTSFSAPPGQPPYSPDNYESKFYGRITLRDSLGNSLNVPAVKVLKYVSVPSFLDLAGRLGITTLGHWDPQWLSLTLGGGEVRLLELTGAYATLARVGNHVPVEPLLEVETTHGDLLHQADPKPPGQQVVDPRMVYQLLHVMGDTDSRLLTFGAQSPLNLQRPHMMKTGTTDDYRDTWTMGCLPQVCVGVWMGNTDNKPMVKVSSSLTAGKVWLQMIQALVERNGWEPVPFPRPDGVVVTRVPSVGGGRKTPDREEVFLPGRDQRPLLQMDWMQPN